MAESDIPEITFEKDAYADILAKESAYDSRAYDFALDVMRQAVEECKKPVGWDDLLDIFSDMAECAYGPLAYAVLRDWGVTSCRDVGKILERLRETGRIEGSAYDSETEPPELYDFEREFVYTFADDQT